MKVWESADLRITNVNALVVTKRSVRVQVGLGEAIRAYSWLKGEPK